MSLLGTMTTFFSEYRLFREGGGRLLQTQPYILFIARPLVSSLLLAILAINLHMYCLFVWYFCGMIKVYLFAVRVSYMYSH